MKETHCVKYRKFKKLWISNIFNKTLILSIVCGRPDSNDEKIVKEEESYNILKILG